MNTKIKSTTMTIKETNTYANLDQIQAAVADMKQSRDKIYRNIEVAKTIGFDQWKKQNDLPVYWHGIVKELAV